MTQQTQNSNKTIRPNQKSVLKINAIIPVFNEQNNIPKFITKLSEKLNSLHPNTLSTLIIINDGSSDNTIDAVKSAKASANIKLINFSRNFGKERAISAGLDYTDSDITLIIDGDFQHPLDTIDQLYQKWQQGYDNIYAIRSERSSQPWLIRKLSNIFYKLNRWMMNIDLPPNAGDFRLLDKKVINALRLMTERNRFMKGLYAWVGFKSCGIPYKVQARNSGASKWGFIKLLDLAITGITSFSNIPLRIWSLIGFGISLVSFIYGVIILFQKVFFDMHIPGFATITCGMFFLGGIQLLSIGVLAEYIARIFEEVKARPRYIIEDIIDI